MIRTMLIINYWGIIATIVVMIVSYFILSFLLNKTKFSNKNKRLIIIGTLLLLAVISYSLKFIVYNERCVEISTAEHLYAGVRCTKHLLF